MCCVTCLQEEREAAEKEKEEVDKLRTMGEEERRVELRNNPKVCGVLSRSQCRGRHPFSSYPLVELLFAALTVEFNQCLEPR